MQARWSAIRRRRTAVHPTASSAALVAFNAAFNAGSAATSALHGRPGSWPSSSAPTTNTMAKDSTPMMEMAMRSPMTRPS
jgi:hypothetical protein